ncbi:Histone H2A [Monocercomonoides exilis]|uniref:Histone H2A n=1 Tax=Monocercomonoides exilis TaxID=2049356 RepID=UPI003559B1AC|nr:Histone H2A [Monocercomonoides exilis]|eukprot:MONOS_5715.1-p1 / transcript=MONOS_5715.1 / gene=MONOS_5715 / organism=Monocercomonoides_exilis_PA203 / gene_product=Histone H2A / transcript_product=Histone H2A / location=Mono_scaffold00170:37276-38212(+) / protein_length=286 / sequence_SO=supercontig / SO=protein_coding / is_pseudo=false
MNHPKARIHSRSIKSGLIFPVGRIHRYLKNYLYNKSRVSPSAAIYTAGVLEYLAAEILELAGGACKKMKSKRVCPRHILLAIKADDELNSLVTATISGAGTVHFNHDGIKANPGKNKDVFTMKKITPIPFNILTAPGTKMCERCGVFPGEPLSSKVLNDLPIGILMENEVETQNLRVLMKDVLHVTPGQAWKEILQNVEIDDNWKNFEIPQTNIKITQNTECCTYCFNKVAGVLFLKFREQIDPNLIPAAMKGKPDCWWGKNCRTQNHSLAHAQKYNHVCPQTRW